VLVPPARPRLGLATAGRSSFHLRGPAVPFQAQSSRLAEFGGLGMSFNICRGTLGSLAMFTAIRNASSRVRYCGAIATSNPSALNLAHAMAPRDKSPEAFVKIV
jgi:hypothetical protein